MWVDENEKASESQSFFFTVRAFFSVLSVSSFVSDPILGLEQRKEENSKEELLLRNWKMWLLVVEAVAASEKEYRSKEKGI